VLQVYQHTLQYLCTDKLQGWTFCSAKIINIQKNSFQMKWILLAFIFKLAFKSITIHCVLIFFLMLLCSRIFTSVIDLFIVFICRKCFTHSFLLQVNFMSSIIQTNSLFCIYYIYKYSSLICILNLFTVIKVCLSLHCITIT